MTKTKTIHDIAQRLKWALDRTSHLDALRRSRTHSEYVAAKCEAYHILEDAIEDVLFCCEHAPEHKLLAIAQRIVHNAQPGQASRHQYADGKGSLAGCSMSVKDITDAQEAILLNIAPGE